MSNVDFAPPGSQLFTAQIAAPIVSVAPAAGQGVPLTSTGMVPAAVSVTPSAHASVGSEVHTTSATYADPTVSGGAGPEISGLADGTYEVSFGGSGGGDFAANVTYHMGISINGSTPADDQSCEFASDRGNTSGAMTIIATLTNGGNNTLKAVYRSSDGTDRGNIRYRWLVALRLGNVT